MELIRLAFCTLLSPISTFRIIPSMRQRFKWRGVAVLTALLVGVYLLGLEMMHYPLLGKSPVELNLVLEIALLLVPLFSWAAASFCTTSIMDGATKLKECILASLYCMMPYVIVMPLLTIFSHLLTSLDSIFYLIQTGMWVWCLALFVISVGVMNEYSVGKTIFVVLLNIIMMATMWAVALLMYALGYQLWDFLRELWLELSYILF